MVTHSGVLDKLLSDNPGVTVLTSYYKPTEGISYLLHKIPSTKHPRGESSKYNTPKDRTYSTVKPV